MFVNEENIENNLYVNTLHQKVLKNKNLQSKENFSLYSIRVLNRGKSFHVLYSLFWNVYSARPKFVTNTGKKKYCIFVEQNKRQSRCFYSKVRGRETFLVHPKQG